MQKDQEQLWQDCVKFHGHACPGLAIGFRIAQGYLDYTQQENTLDFFDENLTCIAETDACGLDAIQYILSCTMGKGNLVLKLRGKNAFSFYNRNNNSSCRIIWIANPSSKLSRAEKMDYFLNAPQAELYKITVSSYTLPVHALISKSIPCVKCGELTAEHYMRLNQGQCYCLDCFVDPSRIL